MLVPCMFFLHEGLQKERMVADHQSMVSYHVIWSTQTCLKKSHTKVVIKYYLQKIITVLSVNHAHYYVDTCMQYSACDICSNCSNVATQCNATDSDTVSLFSSLFPLFISSAWPLYIYSVWEKISGYIPTWDRFWTVKYIVAHTNLNDQLDTLVCSLLLFVEMPSDMYVRLSDQQVH